jgi:RimJ/RimL family protein N-acetyltransferase
LKGSGLPLPFLFAEPIDETTMTRIETERLLLRPPEKSDLPNIVTLLNDFQVSRMLARVPYPYRMNHALGWFSRVNRNGGERVFAVCLDGQAIGMVGFQHKAGRPTLGYWLGRPYWGRGLMSEAVRAVIAWYFERHDAPVLFSGAFEDNPASLGVQRKMGFQVTGSRSLDCAATGAARPEIQTRLSREAFTGCLQAQADGRLTAARKQAR